MFYRVPASLSTQSGTLLMGDGVAREKLWDVNIRLPLWWDTKDRIAAVLHDGEDRTDFIRDAIEDRIAQRNGPPPAPREGDGKPHPSSTPRKPKPSP